MFYYVSRSASASKCGFLSHMAIGKIEILGGGTRFHLEFTHLNSFNVILSSLARSSWPVDGQALNLRYLSVFNVPFAGLSATYAWPRIETSRVPFVLKNLTRS